MSTTLTVQQNLELLGKYQYVEVQMMELMGSWAYTMVDPEIKIGFGRHMYQDSVHADLLGKRIPELKGRSAHFHHIAPSNEFTQLLERIWKLEGDLPRMIGLYRIVKPALVEAYEAHLQSVELPADEPTAYILRHITDEEKDHIAWAEQIVTRLAQEPGNTESIAPLQAELSKELSDSGGVWGKGKQPGTHTFKQHCSSSRRPVEDY